MAVTAELNPSNDELKIMVDGRFDFNDHQVFRESYEKIKQPINRYVIDLAHTDYMDSSALGLLLLLRDHAGDPEKIKIVNAKTNIKDIFDLSHFSSIFDIS